MSSHSCVAAEERLIARNASSVSLGFPAESTFMRPWRCWASIEPRDFSDSASIALGALNPPRFGKSVGKSYSTQGHVRLGRVLPSGFAVALASAARTCEEDTHVRGRMVEGPLCTVESCMGMVPSRASDEATAEYRQRFLLGLLPANGGGRSED